MKTVNGMSFGFSAVNAGQRNVAVEPQLIAVSTEGNFRMTPPVSLLLVCLLEIMLLSCII